MLYSSYICISCEAYDRIFHFLDRNDHPNMIIGQATLGLEIVQQIENIDAVLLPTMIDGCGLTAGIAMAIKECNPKIQIIVSEQMHFYNCQL